ncbi:MAG: PTS sugar transporter subunit IIA [Syntrophomonadaceae bacterium]
MRLTVREVATLLNSPEETVYRWIESGEMPAYRIHDEYRIHRSELLEWATSMRIPVAVDLFREGDDADRIPSVSECLRRGGVFPDVPGTTRSEVLSEIVRHLPLSDGDRDLLRELLLAGGAGGTVAVGGGVAIPHVRKPIVLADDEPVLTLGYLATPVDFGAPDQKPVFALFLLVCPTVRLHLQMLARLARLLREPAFRDAVRARSTLDHLVEVARQIEMADA